MAVMQLSIIFALQAVTFAATVTPENNNSTLACDPNIDESCSTILGNCQEVCGCDKTFKFDEEKGECVVNIEYLKELTAAKNYISSENDLTLEEGIATKLRDRVDRVFQGIIASAIFFVVCASVCVISVLIFCCHIRRSDRKLKNEVDALAKKLKLDIHKKNSMKKKPRNQIEESCNVVVQDANIMCV